MNSVFSFRIAGTLVRVTVSDATGEILGFSADKALSPGVLSAAAVLARNAWESTADEAVAA